MSIRTTPADPASPPAAVADPDRPAGRWPWWSWVAGLAVVVGLTARFVAHSQLWLDEALTVNIAGLPLGEIPEALRHDGSPPLYYVLLHFWMEAFGSSTVAVRLLSAVCSAAALPLAWLAGMRLGGRRVAATALVLFATSPFAVQYASEARMYSLVTLLTLAGGLLLATVVERPSRAHWAGLAVVSAALVLTHYWSIYLLGVTGAVLAWRAWRAPAPAGPRRALLALVTGTLALVPWLPVLLYQARHTGAPWGWPGRLAAVHDTLYVFSAGYRPSGPYVVLLLEMLIVLGVFGRAADRHRVEIDLRGHPPGRLLAGVAFGTLLAGLAAGRISGDAYAPRYAAVVFAGVILVAALGTTAFGDRRLRLVVIGLTVAIGLRNLHPIVFNERTQAPFTARSLAAAAAPGDVVAYCPDQLGPSVSRLVPAGFDEVTFPSGDRPQFVDWVGYAERNRAASPSAFARFLMERAGPDRTIWLVWAPNYKTLGEKCERLRRALIRAHPEWKTARRLGPYPERAGLVRFPPEGRVVTS